MDAKLWLIQDTTVFELNADGVNRWSVQVQPGWRDDGARTSVAEMVDVARMIAAAPDLLEALEYALEYLEDWEDLSASSHCRKARAAIAKATGATP